MTVPDNSQRLEYLDSLRGIAALFVAYFHYSRFFIQEDIVTSGFEYEIIFFFNNYVDLGKVGVIIFFAISGIVIPYSLFKGGRHPVKRFIVSRFARLYPIYWLSIPLGFFAYWHLDGKEITMTTLLFNFTMLQQFFLVENVMGLYWTLQIELIFYFLCVILYLFNWLGVSKKLYYTAILFVLFALVASWFRFQFQIKIPVALFLALAFMFFGAIWRDYLINMNEKSKFYSFMLLIIIITAMPFIAFLAYNQDLGFGETWYRYLLSYYTAIILLVFFTLFVKLRGSFFVWLGRISYSVYLFHGVVFIVFMDLIGNELILNLTLPVHFYVAISIFLTLLFSNVTFNYIEKPMINLGRKVNNKLSPQQSSKVGAA